MDKKTKQNIADKINEMRQDAFVSGYQKGFRECYAKYQVAIEKAVETCREVQDGMDYVKGLEDMDCMSL